MREHKLCVYVCGGGEGGREGPYELNCKNRLLTRDMTAQGLWRRLQYSILEKINTIDYT
jgi:hypothetical protein